MRPQILRPSLIPGATGRAGQDGRDGQNGRDGLVGRDGMNGAPGVVQSVNGKSATSITLTPLDVGAVPQAGDGSATLTRLALTGTGTTGDVTGTSPGLIGNKTLGGFPSPALGQITAGQVPSLDMFSPARNGAVGDETLINAILNGHNICVIKPGGPVTVKNSPIVIPTNGKLLAQGAAQGIFINRDVGYSGDTVQMGNVNGGAGAGSAVIQGFGFNHPGRFVGVVPDNYNLTNRLTAGQAHIRAMGVQGAKIIDCFGWGMPHSIVHSGGSGLDVVRWMSFGGMWNPLVTAQQESLSVFNSVYDPNYGYSVNGTISDPNFIGGNIAASSRTVPLDNKSFIVTNPRIGPRWCYLLQCYEVFKVRGGFSGGFAEANFHFEPGGPATINGAPAWVMIRAEISGHIIDESLLAGVQFTRTLDNTAVATDVRFQGCNFNGQLVGARAITTSQNGKFAVANLVISGGTFAAYQGGAMQLFGVDGGLIAPDRVRGYNYAGFDTTKGDVLASGAGIYVGDVTRNVKVMWPVFGGGANYDTDPNSCQWGLGDVTPVSNGVSTQGNKYYGLDSVNLGLAGGQPSIGGQKFAP
ncbi:hypothetical protein [Methylobacterium komagatae]